MAKTTQQRSADAAARRRQKHIEDLRLPAPPGTRQQLTELMQWHTITISASVAQRLHAAGAQAAARLDAGEQ